MPSAYNGTMISRPSRSDADDLGLGMPPGEESESEEERSFADVGEEGTLELSPVADRAFSVQQEIHAIKGYVNALVRQHPAAKQAAEQIENGLASMHQAILASLESNPASDPIPPMV